MNTLDAPEAVVSSPPSRPLRPRFSIRSLLWLILAVALAMACFTQTRRLVNAERALARSEWASRDVSLPPGKFRLLVNPVLDMGEQKVFVLRVEVIGPHNVSVDGSKSMTAKTDTSGIEFVEVTLFVNYDAQTRHLTTLIRSKSGSGAATGRIIKELPPGRDPADYLNSIKIEPGLYDIGQPVELFREDGQPVQLLVQ